MENEDKKWSVPFRYLIGIILFLALVNFLTYAREAVNALVIAAFIAYLINPAVTFLMEKTKLARAAAVNIVFFSALIILIGAPATLTPIFFNEMKIVAQSVLELSKETSATLAQPVQLGGMTFHLEQFGENLTRMQNSAPSLMPEQALAFLKATSLNTLWVLVIIVSVYLIMSEWPRLRDGLIGFAPPAHQDDVRELYSRVRRIWMAYLRGQIVLMIIVGVVFTIAWLIIGIPGAFVLGVIAGLFTLVPDIGPFVAASLAVGVALLEGSSWIPLSKFGVALIVAVVYLVLINLKSVLLRPYIFGRSVHMHEGLVFISIMIATVLEGILGALLVVPVLASAIVIFEYLSRCVLGLPPFADSDPQFVASPQEQEAEAARRPSTRKPEKRKKNL
jgi:predicted PurR-regulated permease PerM